MWVEYSCYVIYNKKWEATHRKKGVLCCYTIRILVFIFVSKIGILAEHISVLLLFLCKEGCYGTSCLYIFVALDDVVDGMLR